MVLTSHALDEPCMAATTTYYVRVAVVGQPVEHERILQGTGSRLLYAFELTSCDGLPKRSLTVDGEPWCCVFAADGPDQQVNELASRYMVEVIVLCYRSDADGLKALDSWLTKCHAEGPGHLRRRCPIILLRLGDPGTDGGTPSTAIDLHLERSRPISDDVYAHHELLWTFKGDLHSEEFETNCRECRQQMSETFDAVLASAVRAHLAADRARAQPPLGRKRCTIL